MDSTVRMNNASNIMLVKNLSDEKNNNQVFIGCSEKISSYTGSKTSILEKFDIRKSSWTR